MTEAELIDATLRRSGYPGFAEMVERKWLDVSPSFEEQHFLNGFPTRSGKFEFAADWQAVGPLGHPIPALPDHVDIIDRAPGQRPYWMVTPPARNSPTGLDSYWDRVCTYV